MALVIKHQTGGNIQYQAFTPSIQNVFDVRYNTQTIVDYLKDKEKRTLYTRGYRGFDEALTNSFNTTLNSYILGIEDGKIVFSNNGLTKLTNIDNVDPAIEPYVREYFEASIKSGLIPMYNEEYKNPYSVDLNSILSRSLLGEELDSAIFMPAWEALDSKDQKTNLRGISNRKALYIKAIRAEANRLETDSNYRSKFKFPGWENDINAYKRVVQALREHADLIAEVKDFTTDESWILKAAAVGLSAKEIRRKFSTGEVSTDEGEAVQHKDGFDMNGPIFLSTEDVSLFDKNRKYTIRDDYENLPDEVKAAALLLLLLYDRKRILGDWFYWEKYKNLYLENLTPHFSNREVSIYSVSKGPIGNKDKKFFIRRKTDREPIEVELVRNPDGTYVAHNSSLNIDLGQYVETEEARAARTYDWATDLGEPMQFNISEVLKDAESTNNFFNLLIQSDTRYVNPKVYSKILMALSAWLFMKPDGRQYTNWALGLGSNWYGSTFELKGTSYQHPTEFIWKFRKYGIKFVFDKPNNYIDVGGVKTLDPRNIKSVVIDYAQNLKVGGKFRKLKGGGITELVEKQKAYGINRPVEFNPIVPKKPKEELKEDAKYDELNVDGEPTTADRIRFAAATTDLLSSFLIFPKGTNIASLAGTGLSFLGYLTADAIDVVNGKLPAADTLLNDAKLAAVMAMPLFINPTKAKALGAGERMQKLAGMASRFIGTAFALGLIATQELRDDILRSWGKITNPTKMDAHDLTNIAFTIRLVAGGREHIKNFKNNRLLKKALKDNQTGQIDYKVKIGDKETTSSLKVNKGDALDKESVILRIISENEALKLKPELITILNKIKKTSFKERVKDEGEKLLDKFKNKNKEKTKESTEETGENKQEVATESTSEESKAAEETPKSKSNEVVHVDWKDNKTSNPNVEYEEWIPNRAFLYATKENGSIVRQNTTFGGWLRGIFGPNWDLVYSDYRLVKGYRLGKINLLNKGLFTTLDLFRKQGKELEEIRLSTLEGEAKNTALLTKLREFGYNTTDKEAALAKANEIANLYVSDLSKYDNLQIAQMMYDKDREMGIFGGKNTTESKTKKVAEEKSKETEGPKEQSAEQTPKVEDSEQTKTNSKFNPDDLEYINKEDITPELLLEAYKKFLEEKSAQPTEGNQRSVFNQIINSPSRTKDERQALIGKVFENFNIENTKVLMLSQEAIFKKLMRLQEVKNKIRTGENLSPQELLKALKKLVDKGQLSEADYNLLISNSLSEYEVVNGTPSYDLWIRLGEKAEQQKQRKNNYIIKRPANLSTEHWGLLDKILRAVLKENIIKDDIRNKKKPTISELSNLITKYFNNNSLTDLEKSILLTKNNNNNLHYTPEGSIIISEILKYIDNIALKHMLGGKLIFVHQVLSASNGSKLLKFQYGGGIKFTGSWFNDFFKPGIQEVTNDFIKLLDNSDGTYDYLFEPGDDSFYGATSNYLNIRKLYDDNYAASGGYYVPDDDSVRKYQLWIYKHFPSLLRTNTNLALKNGFYTQNGQVLTEEFLPEGVEYQGDNKGAERTMNLHLGNANDITDSNERAQWLKWASYLQDRYKDKYTFYLSNVDGSLNVYRNNTPPSEDLDLTTLSDYITDNNIDLTSVTNPYTPDDASKTDEITDKVPEIKPLPPEWFANLPKDNLTTARLLNTLFGNAMTFAIRDKYKPIFAKDQTYLDFRRVFRDTSAADATNRLYGQFLSREQGASADQRLNTAAAHDLVSKYNTAMLAADELNKKVFDTTSREALEAAKNNSLNLTNTYNSNLKKYADEQKLQQEYTAGAMKQAGENISNLFAALILEKGTERLYSRQQYLTSTMQYLWQLQNKQFLNLSRYYYNKYLTLGGNPSETVDTFYTSNDFKRMTDLYQKFSIETEKIQNTYNENVRNLYRAIYASDLFKNPKGSNANLGSYGGQTAPAGVTIKLTKAKLGGKITMAKQGGASVNWVRVENARMLNKQANTAMRETYKSLRLANAELQKTIRAMEPLIRKLNRRDSVKLK